MILADTSVWIDHFPSGKATLAERLYDQQILGHPWVIGELALGNLRHRTRADVLHMLHSLPQATLATDDEVLVLIEHQKLYGIGIGCVDAQLLAATRLTSGATLWTNDVRLDGAAARIGVAFRP
ncbi:MAG: type II toxin-antitoxin system VapC family toxin [Acidimicrobiales bacterium]